MTIVKSNFTSNSPTVLALDAMPPSNKSVVFCVLLQRQNFFLYLCFDPRKINVVETQDKVSSDVKTYQLALSCFNS